MPETTFAQKCRGVEAWGNRVIERFYEGLPRNPDGKLAGWLDQAEALSLVSALLRDTSLKPVAEP